MLVRVKHYLEPPSFPGDERKTAQARIANTVGLYLALALFIAAVVYVPFFVLHKLESWGIIFVVFILYIIARAFLFRGQVILASVMMIVSGWIICQVLAFIGGGIASPIMFVLSAITIAIGMLFRPRSGIVFLVFNILAGLVFAALQQAGVVLPHYLIHSPLGIWFYFAMSLIFVYWTINLTMRKLEITLTQVQHQNDALEKAGKMLRESEANFREVFDNTAHGIFIVDIAENGSFSIGNRNKAEEKATGVRHEDVLGKSLEEAYPPPLAQLYQANYRRCLKEAVPISFEEEVDLPEGPRFYYTMLAPVRDRSGRIYRLIGSTMEITDRKEMEKELRFLSTHDTLTGIFNRSFFQAEMARIERGRDYPVSIIIADLDNLKVTNDRYGHPTGDELLKHTADVLQTAFRGSDFLARIGGDEFAILLPATDSIMAEQILARVRLKLTEHNAAYPDLPILLSLGGSTTDKGKLMDGFALADQRMYAEKAVHKAKMG